MTQVLCIQWYTYGFQPVTACDVRDSSWRFLTLGSFFNLLIAVSLINRLGDAYIYLYACYLTIAAQGCRISLVRSS